jgi:hypothetical protein
MSNLLSLFSLSEEELHALFVTYYNQVEDFVLDMTVELAHDYLFLTVHFPIFFVIHATWVCVVIRRFAPKTPWYKSLVAGASMAFLGRTLVALICNRRAPLLDHPLYIPLFFGIWFLVNCFPFDLIFKILRSYLFVILFQFLYLLIQVRETCHGVDIGVRTFPRGGTGAVFLSAVLASTESFVWLLLWDEVREFSNRAVIKNMVTSILYWGLTQYPELVEDYFEATKENVKIYALAGYAGVLLLDMIFFGPKGRRGIDITGLRYVGMLFGYGGDRN